MVTKKVGGMIILAGVILAAVVSFQDVKMPYAPRGLVIEVGALTARVATNQMKSLNAQLLANQILQDDLKLKGLRVPDPYRQQAQGFEEDIEKLERELEGLKK